MEFLAFGMSLTQSWLLWPSEEVSQQREETALSFPLFPLPSPLLFSAFQIKTLFEKGTGSCEEPPFLPLKSN